VDGGLSLPIFGGLAYVGPFTAAISIERALGLPPDPVRRLGALAVAVTEDARRLASRLRLTNAETKVLDSMGHRWWRLAGMSEARARRRLYRLGEHRYRDRLILAWARSGDGSDAASWHELATLPARWSAIKPRRVLSANPKRESRDATQGHFTSGGIDDRIESTLPPVFRPKSVPRS
jgi:hypothetical protein